MKANEFVKKFGWGAAKNILHGMDDATEFTTHMPGDTWDEPTLIDAVGLRRLVESHELVERIIGDHNKSFEECQIDIPGLKSFIKKNPKIYPKRLKQAIADVESCHVD